MTKMNLFLFTETFPYGTGEKPFVIPEIEYLSDFFDITIVSSSPKELTLDKKNTTSLPSNVKLLRIDKGGKAKMLLRVLSYPFSKICREDAKSALSEEKGRFKKLVNSLRYYCSGKAVLSFCNKNGVFNDLDNSIYYAYWLNHYTLGAALKKRNYPSLRLVCRAHGADLFNEYSRSGRHPFQKWVADSCDKLIFVAEQGVQYFRSTFGEENAPGKLLVLPVGTPPPEKTGLNPSMDHAAFTIVSCSYVYPPKRVHLVAEALSVLNKPDIHWIHFGGGEDFEELAKLVSKLNINATLMGQLPNTEVKEFYAQHLVDAFINTSEHEGSAVSISEAMSYGIPIIATKVGGTGEQIDGNGVLLSPNPSVEEIASGIMTLYEASDDEIQSYRNASRSLWKLKFDQEQNIRSLKMIFDELADET